MMKHWYYKISDKKIGPISEEELLNAIEHGELTKDTMIQDEEMSMWVKASSIDGLLSASKHEEQTKKLPVFGTISEAFTVMKENINVLWKPLLITGLLMIALNSFLFPETIVTFWLYRAVYVVAFIMFTITTHRVILLGKESVASHGLSWSKKEWTFILYSIGIYIATFVLSFLLLPLFAILGSSEVPYLIFLVFIPIMIFSARLSMLIPAISIEKIDIDWSWAMAISKNNGFRLFAVLFIVPFILNIVLRYMTGISIALNILAETIVILLLVFEIILLSLSFRYLTGFEKSESKEL